MRYWIVRFLALVAAKILFRLEVRGAGNIPKSGSFILAGNHNSYLDPAVLAVACPRELRFMARHDLFEIPLFGAFISSVGAIPLKRNSGDISGIKEALRCLRKTIYGLLIFPEGSRALSGASQDPKPGIGFMAAKSGVPVVPAFIQGSQRALGRGARLIRPVKIRVYFGNPIHFDDKGIKDDYEKFSTRIIQEINRLS
ncbi:MAG: lysophospholipid acyltransferase family protein [Candidatus Omnitrophota bacterium]